MINSNDTPPRKLFGYLLKNKRLKVKLIISMHAMSVHCVSYQIVRTHAVFLQNCSSFFSQLVKQHERKVTNWENKHPTTVLSGFYHKFLELLTYTKYVHITHGVTDLKCYNSIKNDKQLCPDEIKQMETKTKQVEFVRSRAIDTIVAVQNSILFLVSVT